MDTKLTYPPTAEQQQAIDLFATRKNLIIEAGAGTGKTSTLVMLAEQAKLAGLKGAYIAFNKALVVDATKRFDLDVVSVKTMHAMAMAFFNGRPALKARFDRRERLSRREEARILRVEAYTVVTAFGEKRFAPEFVAGHVMGAIHNFCQSADPAPAEHHFPIIDKIDEIEKVDTETGEVKWKRGPNNRKVAHDLLPAAQRAWADIMSETGKLKFDFEHYLKGWQLSDPKLGVDFILFDEAQDVSPVMEAIVLGQNDHAQLVFVGDSNQAIYGFTGAKNSMTKLAGMGDINKTFLSKSFRFGPAVADVANQILDRIPGNEMALVGHDPIPSVVCDIDGLPDALLCRTNAIAVTSALRWMDEGYKVAIGENLKRDAISFAKGAEELRRFGRTSNRELVPFSSWTEVQEFVADDPAGGDLRLMVKLVDEFGADVIIRELGNTVKEAKADVTVTTAHTSKGREWNRVRLASDFVSEKQGEDPKLRDGLDETRLLYVAVTRAQIELDLGPVGAILNDEPVEVTVTTTTTIEVEVPTAGLISFPSTPDAEMADTEELVEEYLALAAEAYEAPADDVIVTDPMAVEVGQLFQHPDYETPIRVFSAREHRGGRRILGRIGNGDTIIYSTPSEVAS